MKKRKDKSIETDSWWQGHAKTDPQGSWTGNRQTPWKRPCRTRTIFDARRSARGAYIWRRYEILETPQTGLPGFEDGDCRNADASGVQPVF